MHTSVALVAVLATCLSAASPSASPTWHKDYGAARKIGQNEKKPLAVVLGTGEANYVMLCQEGELNAEVKKLLAVNYVCVYVDVMTPDGEKLATALAITSGKGVVLSDRTGDLQAFYHDGDLSEADLTKALTRFANASVVVTTTITNVNQRTSYYPSSSGNSTPSTGNTPSINYAPPQIRGSFPAGGFGGGRSC